MAFKLTDTRSDASSNVALSYNSNSSADQQIGPDVIMEYPTAETSYRFTRAIFPKGSKFHVGAHWHEDYDEYMHVVKGRARIRLGTTWKVYTPEDGEILIPKNVVHDLGRADVHAKPGEEDEGDLILEERSDPDDGAKELFFRNVFSSASDKAAFGWKLPLQQLLVLMYSDAYISIVPGPAGWYATYGLYAVLKPLAKLLGLRPYYDEYTPDRLRGIKKKLEAGESTKTA